MQAVGQALLSRLDEHGGQTATSTVRKSMKKFCWYQLVRVVLFVFCRID